MGTKTRLSASAEQRVVTPRGSGRTPRARVAVDCAQHNSPADLAAETRVEWARVAEVRAAWEQAVANSRAALDQASSPASTVAPAVEAETALLTARFPAATWAHGITVPSRAVAIAAQPGPAAHAAPPAWVPVAEAAWAVAVV